MEVFTGCHDAIYWPEVFVVPTSVVRFTKHRPVPAKVCLNVDVRENHVHMRICPLSPGYNFEVIK